MKASIMRAANQIVNALLFCNDFDFVDEVVARIASGTTFDEKEIETAERCAENEMY